MPIATLGIDWAKDVFHLAGLDEPGQVIERAKKRRSGLMRYLAQLKPCHAAREACAGAHPVARKAEAMGHQTDLLPAQYVKPYTKSQKERRSRCRGHRGNRQPDLGHPPGVRDRSPQKPDYPAPGSALRPGRRR